MISCYGLVFAGLATVCHPTIVCLGSGHPEVYTALNNNNILLHDITQINILPNYIIKCAFTIKLYNCQLILAKLVWI